MTDEADPPRRKSYGGGRPRADEPGERVSTYLRTSDYDRLLRLANDRDQTLSETVRELLRLKLR